jgi:CheY-like chemotaxis protein
MCIVEDDAMNRLLLKAKLTHIFAKFTETHFTLDEFDSGEAVLGARTRRMGKKGGGDEGGEGGGGGGDGEEKGADGEEAGEGHVEGGDGGEEGEVGDWDIIIIDEYLQCGGLLGSEATKQLRKQGCAASIIACSANCTGIDQVWHTIHYAHCTLCTALYTTHTVHYALH